MLKEDRFFDPDPTQKSIAIDLYNKVKDLPIISPHGHVDPALFSDPERGFGNPVELLLQPDHYVIRMLYSQGLSFDHILSQEDPRKIWQTFADHFYLYRGTPSGMWLTHEMQMVFDVKERLTGKNALNVYDQIQSALLSADFLPRNLFKKFNIEVLATTDSASDDLKHHQAIKSSGWDGKIIPTFRPEDVVNLLAVDWHSNIERLEVVTGMHIVDFASFIHALEKQRTFFKSLGATATDISMVSPKVELLSSNESDSIFQRALAGETTKENADKFMATMLYELARMSSEDGLVMQIHAGIIRNHNPFVYEHYGADKGFDIPVQVEFTRSLQPILADFGNHPNFRLILFTLDESTYTRELAPLAGAYPSVKLGPPWWFNDSWNGMRRYFDQVIETAGLYNTSGFNDDTRAFLSIPARHDVWRRASANWLAGQYVRGLIEIDEAEQMIVDLAVGLVKKAYRL